MTSVITWVFGGSKRLATHKCLVFGDVKKGYGFYIGNLPSKEASQHVERVLNCIDALDHALLWRCRCSALLCRWQIFCVELAKDIIWTFLFDADSYRWPFYRPSRKCPLASFFMHYALYARSPIVESSLYVFDRDVSRKVPQHSVLLFLSGASINIVNFFHNGPLKLQLCYKPSGFFGIASAGKIRLLNDSRLRILLPLVWHYRAYVRLTKGLYATIHFHHILCQSNQSLDEILQRVSFAWGVLSLHLLFLLHSRDDSRALTIKILKPTSGSYTYLLWDVSYSWCHYYRSIP